MSDHARLAPSACSRWVTCPGSLQLSEALTSLYPPKDSPAAARGTYLHDLAEKVCTGELGLGELPDDVTQEEIDGLALYQATVLDRAATGAKVEYEVKLRNPSWHPQIWGTADCLIYDGTTLELIDLKTGYYDVDPVENYQLICYAMLALGYYKITPDTIVLTIVQPRAAIPVKSWTTSLSELMLFGTEIKHGANLALSPEGSTIFRPGKAQCQWCPAAGECKAQLKSQAISDFMEDTPPLNIISDEQMAELLDGLDEVDQFISALRAKSLERAMSGRQIPGYKVVPRKTNRRWSDPKEVLQRLASAQLPSSFYIEEKLKSFTQVLKHPEARTLVEDLVVKPQGEPQLVPLSDPRDSYDPNDDFRDE